MNGEYHVTVDGDPFCARHGIKPLWIELNNFNRQVLSASAFDPTNIIAGAGWSIIRTKFEVQPSRIDISTHDKANQFIEWSVGACYYYECHVKLDGPFLPTMPMASRDLYRPNRWYCTMRHRNPFDYAGFVREVTGTVGAFGSYYAGHEYEACLSDTNEGLDAGWR